MNAKTVEVLTLQKKYKLARTNALGVIGFTLINIILALAGSNLYFLFSAEVPLIFAQLGVSSEIDKVIGIAFIVIAVIMLAVYVVLWVLSKKHYGFMIALGVLFGIDCAILLVLFVLAIVGGEFDASIIIDLLFHAWVMYEFAIGIIVGAKLKAALPQGVGATESDIVSAFEAAEPITENAENAFAGEEPEFTGNGLPDSPVLHDFNGKGMNYAMGVYRGAQVAVYRKPTATELVINGKVYAERKGLIFKSYEIECNYGGVTYKFKHVMKFSSAQLELYANDEVIAINSL